MNEKVRHTIKQAGFACLFVLFFNGLYAQTEQFRIVSYNVENFFDCIDDTATLDEEYLPGGMRGWNNTKYKQKQANIAKVIAAIGGWTPPALIALCEIESRKCLTDLTKYALKAYKYEFTHYESPDARGIDVALLYHPRQFTPLCSQPITVELPDSRPTRDILYAKGLVLDTDTLHVFVCHFPSRLGGELASENKRLAAAAVVRAHIDSIFAQQPAANIIVMGDFNDYPENRSVAEVIGGRPLDEMPCTTKMYNLMHIYVKQDIGTYKYQGNWGCLDQFIVSENLLNPNSTIHTSQENTHIFNAEWLQESDQTHLGTKPFRTYIGMKYNGGFSDHLPIYIDLSVSPEP